MEQTVVAARWNLGGLFKSPCSRLGESRRARPKALANAAAGRRDSRQLSVCCHVAARRGVRRSRVLNKTQGFMVGRAIGSVHLPGFDVLPITARCSPSAPIRTSEFQIQFEEK
jgi:hypothetical protein